MRPHLFAAFAALLGVLIFGSPARAEDPRLPALQVTYEDVRSDAARALDVLPMADGLLIVSGGVAGIAGFLLKDDPDFKGATPFLLASGALFIGTGAGGFLVEDDKESDLSVNGRLLPQTLGTGLLIAGLRSAAIFQDDDLNDDLLRLVVISSVATSLQAGVSMADGLLRGATPYVRLLRHDMALRGGSDQLTEADLDQMEADLDGFGRRDHLLTLPTLAGGLAMVGLELSSPSKTELGRIFTFISGGALVGSWALVPLLTDTPSEKYKENLQISVSPGAVSLSGSF